MIQKKELDGEWTLCLLNTGEKIPAKVPGSVYSDFAIVKQNDKGYI